MPDNVISVENLGKSYIVGHNRSQHEKYQTLRDVLTREARGFVRKTRDMIAGRAIVQGDEIEEFWALKNINFSVQPGDRVGIVGRNGSGKSTMLKVLSRITDPTEGRIRINGRVSSLLEVGTGFHPELTGRENVFLNGAILGMSRREIRAKFDEIVDFAGIEKFLDTPVKRYSSGMYVRLAFAVAAHLEPEILIVDEVLAVGDAEFQKKCLGKMEEVGREGRTILFVSHNMSAVRSLCNRALYIRKGALLNDSRDVGAVIGNYLEEGNSGVGLHWENSENNPIISEHLHPISFLVQDGNGIPLQGPIGADKEISIRLEVDVLVPHSELVVGYALHDEMGNLLYWTYTKDKRDQALTLRQGRNVVESTIPRNILNDGRYRVTLISGIMNERSIFTIGDSDVRISFEIFDAGERAPYWLDKRQSMIGPVIEWRFFGAN